MWCASLDGIGWADDFPYSHMPLEGGSEPDFFDCKGEVLTGFSQVPEACLRHYMVVNGRLANLLAFGVLLLPGWCVFLLNSLAFAGMLLGILRLTFGREWGRHYLALLLAAIALWVALPWQDNLASQDYFMNYVWSSALNLLFLSLLFCPSPRIGVVKLCLLGAIAATMHEGMSVAICAGLLIMLFARKRESSLAPLLVYMLFSLWPLLSPGIWALAGKRTSVPFDLHFFTHTIALAAWPVVVAGLLTVWNALRNHSFTRRSLVVWCIILTAIAICIVSHQGGRALWLPLCLSIVVILSLVRPRLSVRWKRASTAVSFAALMIWGLWVCAWQYYASRERNLLIAELRGGSDIVYIDLLQPDEMPWLLMGTVAYVNGDQTVRSNIAAHLYGDAWRVLALLPRDWQGKQIEELPSIPGTAGAHGLPYMFLTRRPVKEARYIHDPSRASTVARNPLKSVRSYIKSDPREETILMENRQLSDSLWVCRPLYIAPSLVGVQVVQIDYVSNE